MKYMYLKKKIFFLLLLLLLLVPLKSTIRFESDRLVIVTWKLPEALDRMPAFFIIIFFFKRKILAREKGKINKQIKTSNKKFQLGGG